MPTAKPLAIAISIAIALALALATLMGRPIAELLAAGAVVVAVAAARIATETGAMPALEAAAAAYGWGAAVDGPVAAAVATASTIADPSGRICAVRASTRLSAYPRGA